MKCIHKKIFFLSWISCWIKRSLSFNYYWWYFCKRWFRPNVYLTRFVFFLIFWLSVAMILKKRFIIPRNRNANNTIVGTHWKRAELTRKCWSKQLFFENALEISFSALVLTCLNNQFIKMCFCSYVAVFFGKKAVIVHEICGAHWKYDLFRVVLSKTLMMRHTKDISF